MRSVAFSPDGRHLLSGGLNRVILWDVANGDKILEKTYEARVEVVAFAPDGKHAITGTAARRAQPREAIGQGLFSYWGIASGDETFHLDSEGRVRGVAFVPNSNLAVITHGGPIAIVDLAEHAVVMNIRKGNSPQALDVDSDGRYIAVTDYGMHYQTCPALRIIEVGTWKEHIMPASEGNIWAISWLRGKKSLVFGCQNGAVRLMRLCFILPHSPAVEEGE